MEKEYIDKQLQKFDLTDAAINDLTNQYRDLKINGIDDTEGYKAVRAARIDLKNYRISIDKKRKELTEDALKYQRSINAEAKRIISLLEPLELKLEEQEKSIDKEKERIKTEKKQAAELRLKERMKKLASIEILFSFALEKFICDYSDKEITPLSIEFMTDEQFLDLYIALEADYVEHIKSRLEKEQKEVEEKKRLEEQQKAEIERINKIKREQEIESKRLDDIAEKQHQENIRLKAEFEKLEKERKGNTLISTKDNLSDLKPTIVFFPGDNEPIEWKVKSIIEQVNELIENATLDELKEIKDIIDAKVSNSTLLENKK